MRIASPLPLASAHPLTPSAATTETVKPAITARACAITPQAVNMENIEVAPHPVGLRGAVVRKPAAVADTTPP